MNCLNSMKVDKAMKYAAIMIAGLLLASCASVEPALFRDPKTGQVAQCTSTAAGGFFPLINAWTAQHEIDTCAAAYTRMGWVQQ
ncbi:MAG: hypothetical protein WCD70_06470 [Alphaproteobacteria bacterium]